MHNCVAKALVLPLYRIKYLNESFLGNSTLSIFYFINTNWFFINILFIIFVHDVFFGILLDFVYFV